MRNSFFTLLCFLFLSSCSYKVYVVRHAEKAATPPDNPTLSPDGTARALDLRQALQNKKIKKIYSTNTTRTLSTVEPLALVLDLKPTIYVARPDSAFISTLKSNAINQLVVGHSNTIDDIANMLAGQIVVPGDLPETVFDNLYVLKFKKNGKGRARFVNKKYGSSKTSDQGKMK